MRLRGIAASTGVAVGPAFLYAPSQRIVARERIAAEQAPQELARLATALDDARAQITALRDVAAQRIGAEEAAIFDAHLLMLDDEVLLEGIRERISQHYENAEAASWDAIQDYRRQMLEIDDAYLSARAADLEDIATRLLACLRGEAARTLSGIAQPSIVVARDLLPSDTATLDPARVLALVTEEGGPTAHTAILARQLGIPAVVCAVGILDAVSADASAPQPTVLAVDGDAGVVEVQPDADTVRHYADLRQQLAERRARLVQLVTLPAVTPDGRHVELLANIGSLRDLAQAVELGAAGIGLFRTEFLFLNRQQAPTEDEQTHAYLEASRAFPAGYVIIRTLDIGGDKSVPYLPQQPEANPFLGLRGLRLCLAPHFRPIFKTQLRALLRAATQGARVHIMFPMVNSVEELREARALLREVADELEAQAIPALGALANVPVGAMIETPAAAFMTDILAEASDFFSIGTNDLTQYMLAVDRMNSVVAPLYDPLHLPVLRSISAAVAGAHQRNRRIGMCGELAGTPIAIPLLLGLGLDEFSMNAESLLEAKRIIRACDAERGRTLVQQVYALANTEDITRALTVAHAGLPALG